MWAKLRRWLGNTRAAASADTVDALDLISRDPELARLADEHPEMVRRWRLLAVFAGDFDASAAAAVWVLEPDAARIELDGLAQRSLVQHDTLRSRYRLPEPYRARAEAELGTTAEAARRCHAKHYCEMLNEIRHSMGLESALAVFDRERANIEAGQTWAAAHLDEADCAAMAIEYANAGIHMLQLRMPPHRQIPWLEAALAACRRLGRSMEEGTTLTNLGVNWASSGEPRKAIAAHEQSLAIAREIGNRQLEGVALGNLARVLGDQGELVRACGLICERLELVRGIGDRHGEAVTLGQLATAWGRVDSTGKAIELREQSLVLFGELGDLVGESETLAALANDWAAHGDPAKAATYHERHLAIARLLGDARGEGIGLWNYALTLEEAKQRESAIAKSRAAFAILRELDHPAASMAESWLRERGIDPDQP